MRKITLWKSTEKLTQVCINALMSLKAKQGLIPDICIYTILFLKVCRMWAGGQTLLEETLELLLDMSMSNLFNAHEH